MYKLFEGNMFCVPADGGRPGPVQELHARHLGEMAGGGGRDRLRDDQPGGRQDGEQEEVQAKAEVRH